MQNTGAKLRQDLDNTQRLVDNGLAETDITSLDLDIRGAYQCLEG